MAGQVYCDGAESVSVCTQAQAQSSVEEKDVTDREGNKVWNTKHCLSRLSQGQYKNAKNLDGGNKSNLLLLNKFTPDGSHRIYNPA